MGQNVVRLVRARPRSFTSAERLLEQVRTEIFECGDTYKVLAVKTGVARTTIANIATGKTKWPRQTTLFPMLKSMGLGMRLVRLDGDE